MSNLSPSALITVQVRSTRPGRLQVMERLVDHRERTVLLLHGREIAPRDCPGRPASPRAAASGRAVVGGRPGVCTAAETKI